MSIDLSKYGQPITGKSKTGVDLSKYGAPVDYQPSPQEDGFFKNFYKSLFEPVVNLVARPGQAVQSALGQEPSTGRFLGLDVTAPKTGRDVLKDVGRGLETVALGIGGGGTSNVVRTGLKSGISAGLKEGAIVGLKSSPLLGAGASLEAGNTDIRTILKDAAVSTVVGTPLTAVLGGITPVGSAVVKKLTPTGLREELGNIFRQTGAKYIKAQAVLDQAEHVSKTDPIAVLQMYGKNVIPEMKGGGANTEEAQLFLKKKIGELSNLRNEDLFLNNERVPLEGYRKYANELLDAQSWSDTKKAAERINLNKILDKIDSGYKNSPKNVGGIELNELGLVKTEQTNLSKAYNNPKAPFGLDAHAIAGKAARDLQELLTDSPTTKDLNKLIQSHYDAIDFLSEINGKKIHGGALSKAFLKLGGDIVGAVAGQSLGSPIIGAVTGHVVASKVADIVQNRFITNPIKRMLINNLKEQAPKEVNAALKSLESKYADVFQELFPNSIKSASPITKPISANTINISDNIPQKPKINKRAGFIIGATPYKETGDLTTKILKDLEGKTTVSKQYILDATNRGELKQVERDITRQVLDTMPDGQINVKEFADKVKQELLPLKRTTSDINAKPELYNTGAGKYENIALPDELRGNVKTYNENIYQSPIKTSAGSTHFSENSSPNYFGHTRIEDMADNKTRRVIEVQSDLYQKGNLEREVGKIPDSPTMSVADYEKKFGKIDDLKSARQKEISKLQQYNDPTAHFRMVREEIKKASQDGKTKLQFPTGETAMKIEGLGENASWADISQYVDGDEAIIAGPSDTLSPDQLKVGQRVARVDEGIGSFSPDDSWIITDVLGDGKFKAVPKDKVKKFVGGFNGDADASIKIGGKDHVYPSSYTESFDISGKVDTNNPIYKFYEKDMQKYLNKFGGKRIVDDRGVSWIEVPVKKEWAKLPVEAFGRVALNPLVIGAGLTGVGALISNKLNKK